ncbi:proline-serine-threonine phosphatase-interacting protein 2-like [Babylonia areolata]|uniref:proline-serine-threonine phosphatase-interacting protein 2-like n=1 Tax=Babylonia areolata TaxID=304850 RepID=UPI003FD0A9E3
MTKLTQYAEAFWGTDFLSTSGSDTLSKHNTEEKKFLQDFEEYLRKRSKMELEYSKSLAQLSRSLKDRPVVGVLEASWNCLRGELDTCRQSHEEAGLFFAHHAEETKRFCKDIVNRRESVEGRLKKVQNQKSTMYKNMMSLNKTYRQKCQEKDQAKDQYDIMRREVTSTVKELDKARTKRDKTDEEATRADSAYKTSTITLEDMRQEWEREMEVACKEFQDYDEEQICFLRSEMWMSVNRVSQTAFDVDESCERVRKILETCDVNQDVQSFISQFMTGTERPAPVPYQNYYDTGAPGSSSGGGGGSNSRAGSASSSDTFQRAPVPPPPASAPAPAPTPVPALGNHGGSSAFYSLAHNVADSVDPDYSTVDPTYSTAEPFPDPSVRQLTVSKSFQTPPNFSVQAGEKVTFLRKVNPNVVEVKTHLNKIGNIPLACIRETV